MPCGRNNFHTYSEAEKRLPRDRGISEEIDLKDTNGYVISSAPPRRILSDAFSPLFPVTSLFLKAARHPVDALKEECAHREAAAKATAVHKEYFDYQMAKIKICFLITRHWNRESLEEI